MSRGDILIVGGGIAGVTAAETVRRLAPGKSVTIVEHENHPLYSRVLLREYVAGKIPREKVFLRTLDSYNQKGIQYFPGTRVQTLNLDQKEAKLSNGGTIQFNAVLLSSGGYPRPWNIPGGDLAGILRFQTIEDADALIAACKSAKQAVVVGASFIGMDFIQAFVHAHVPTTVVMRGPHYWSPLLDLESAGLIEDVLRRNNVQICFKSEVERVVGTGSVEGVILKDGAQIPADAVGLGIGIAPDFGYLSGSGVTITDGVRVNEYLEADRPDILAAGDAANFFDMTVSTHHRLGNWTNGVGHGLAVGKTLAGTRTPYRAVSAYTVEYLGLPVAFIGDCHPHPDNVEIIRGSRASGSIGRLLLRGGRLVGATLLNRTAERNSIQQLIRSGLNVSKHHAALADPSASLAILAQ